MSACQQQDGGNMVVEIKLTIPPAIVRQFLLLSEASNVPLHIIDLGQFAGGVNVKTEKMPNTRKK
jgi:hypothetical protein